MNKTQFLKQLRYRLEGRLPEEELADVLSYYEAYFDDSEEDEEAVAERLGSPASVAEQVLKDAGDCARPAAAGASVGPWGGGGHHRAVGDPADDDPSRRFSYASRTVGIIRVPHPRHHRPSP